MAHRMLHLFCGIKQKQNMRKNYNNRKFNGMTLVLSVAIRQLYQKINKTICEIAKEYPKFTRRSISRHAKLPTSVDSDDSVLYKRPDNPGRQKNC